MAQADTAPRETWPWLAAIIAGEAMNFRRKRALRQAVSLALAGEPAMREQQSEIEQAELNALVHLALNQLSTEQRVAIVLTHLAGLTHEQAASALGVPVNTLKARVRRGLDSLREVVRGGMPELERALHSLPVTLPAGGIAAVKASCTAAVGVQAALAAKTGLASLAVMKAVTAAALVIAVSSLVVVFAVPDPPKAKPAVARVSISEPATVVSAAASTPTAPPAETRAERPQVFAPWVAYARKENVKPAASAHPIPAEPEIQPADPKPQEEPAPSPRGWSHSLPLGSVDEGLQPYTAVAGINGNISSVGSDTLNNLMTLWADGFNKFYPNVRFSIEGKGSTTAPPALIDGTADLGPMSRAMKKEEVEKFEKKYGYKPGHVGVAIDALAVFVHKDNPLQKISLVELDAVFSATRKGGHEQDIAKWGELGLGGDWLNAEITFYGRNSASGTYGYFKQIALFKGNFKDAVKQQPGSAAVVQCVSVDRNSIGYSGLAYQTAGVKALAISKKPGEAALAPEAEQCYAGKYPLARYLYIYFNRAPGEEVTPVVREFLRFIHSKEGQEIVVRDGHIPLTRKVADKFADAYR